MDARPHSLRLRINLKLSTGVRNLNTICAFALLEPSQTVDAVWHEVRISLPLSARLTMEVMTSLERYRAEILVWLSHVDFERKLFGNKSTTMSLFCGVGGFTTSP